MTPTLLTLTVLLLVPSDSETPRKPHPFAPSLPQLTDEEEDKLDDIINRFILHDSGRLPGAEGTRARAEFDKLGPNAIPALIRGLRRGNDALNALGVAAATYENDVRDLARDQLARQLGNLSPADLKEKFKDDKAEIRAAAIRVAADKGLRWGAELIDLLADENR